MKAFRRFTRSLALVVAVLFGAAGVAQSAAYTLWPAWSVDTVTLVLTYTNTLLQFGLGTGAPAHLASGQTTAPALTSCGTSPAISGSDTAGTVTMGTGSPTGCVITFNVAYTTAPHCNVTWRATPLVSQSYTVSAAAITLTQTATSSNLADYTCIAPSGG